MVFSSCFLPHRSHEKTNDNVAQLIDVNKSGLNHSCQDTHLEFCARFASMQLRLLVSEYQSLSKKIYMKLTLQSVLEADFCFSVFVIVLSQQLYVTVMPNCFLCMTQKEYLLYLYINITILVTTSSQFLSYFIN